MHCSGRAGKDHHAQIRMIVLWHCGETWGAGMSLAHGVKQIGAKRSTMHAVADLQEELP
jgi:hypothetical protein